MKRFLSLILAFFVLVTLVGCAEHGDTQDTDANKSSNADDMFSKRDLDSSYSEDDATVITFDGDKITLSDSSASAENTTVTLDSAGTYILSGTLDDGCVTVDAPKDEKLQIVLDGVHITSSTSAAISVRSADKVIFTLAEGSENSLSNGGSFEEDEDGTDGALFAKDDITFNGTGSLEIVSPAGHGIVAKDDLAIVSGTLKVSSASHGINANDSIRILTANLEITSGKDALHAENKDDDELGFIYIADGDFALTSEGDGISASAYIDISDGVFNINAGGGAKMGEKESSDFYGRFDGAFGDFHGGKGDGKKDDFKPDDMTPEDATDGVGGEVPNAQPGGIPGNAPDNVPDDLPDNMGDFAPGDIPEDLPDELPDDMGDFDPGNVPGNMPDNMQGRPGGMGGGMLDDGSGENATDESDSTSMKGIKAGGDLTIYSGEFNLDCADDSVHSNSSVTISGGKFKLATGDDGVHADENLTISDGEIEISESYEGLEALHIVIDGGKFNIISDDDGINAAGGADSSGDGGRDGRFGHGGMASSNGSIVINSGEIYINASGDGIDANGSLEINGGNITIVGPTVGDTSTLDFDTTGVINGGTFFGTGSSSMAQSFTGGEQAFICLKTRSTYSAGTKITVTDAEGNEIASAAPELDFNYIIVSSDKLISGETYSVSVDGDVTECTAK